MQAPQQTLPLKDIHFPDAVSWWPPAPGYWLILLIILLFLAIFFGLREYRLRYRIKRAALKELTRITANFETALDNKKLVTEISALLRRAAISSYPRSDCASLTGNNWIQWLDSQFTPRSVNFSEGPGYLLTDFSYSKSQHADDIQQLIVISRQWLQQLPAVKAVTETQP